VLELPPHRLPARLRLKVLLGLPFYGYEYVQKGRRVESAEAATSARLLGVLREQAEAAAAAQAAEDGGGEERPPQECGAEEGEEEEGSEDDAAGTCAALGSDSSSGGSSGGGGSSQLRIRWLEEASEHVFRWSPGSGDGAQAGKQGKKKQKRGLRHQLYFPTPVMLAERLAVAAQHGMGAAVWELGQGLDSFCSLL
jgi:hypothetical protein